MGLALIGDSKTQGQTCCVDTGGYRDPLIAAMALAGEPVTIRVLANGGFTTAQTAAVIDAWIAAQTGNLRFILLASGTNDIPGINLATITEPGWLVDYRHILDNLHARWPDAKIYCARPYYQSNQTAYDLLDDTWIPDAITGRAWAFLGPDERTFLPGHTSDLTHPDSSGYTLYAGQWKTFMGY